MTKPSTPTAVLLRERLRAKLQDAGLPLDWMAMMTDNDVAVALCSWKLGLHWRNPESHPCDCLPFQDELNVAG